MRGSTDYPRVHQSVVYLLKISSKKIGALASSADLLFLIERRNLIEKI